MKKLALISSVFIMSHAAFAQSSLVKKAIADFSIYQQDHSTDALKKSYQTITEAYNKPEESSSPITSFYYGVISKTYYDQVKTPDKPNMILSAANALENTIKSDKKIDEQDQALTYLTYICFDMYQEGIDQYNAKNNDMAYKLYNRLIKEKSFLEQHGRKLELKTPSGDTTRLSNKDILNNYAIFCLNDGKKDEALKSLTDLVNTNPSPTSYAQLIQLAGQIGDSTTVSTYLKKALALYPNDQELLIFSINDALNHGDSERALAELNKAIANNPREDFYLIKGQTLDALAQNDKAREAYEAGLKINPNNYGLNYNLGVTLFNQALAIMNSKQDSNNPDFKNLISLSKGYFEKAKQIDPAKNDIDKIINDINKVK